MTLKINPGCSTIVQSNPLCPKCEKQIVPVEKGEEKMVYTCGCNTINQFRFTKRSNMIDDIHKGAIDF